MNLSGFICLMALPWFLGPLNPKKRHWSNYLIIYSGVALMLWNLGIGEYSRQFRYYSCKSKLAYGIPNNRYPTWCNEFELVKPNRRYSKKIFSFRERVAISIHHLVELSIKGLSGLTENSHKGLRMYFVRSPIEGIEYFSIGERRRLCTDKGHLGGETRSNKSDFAMNSPRMRSLIAKHLPKVDQIQSWENRGVDINYYTASHPLRELLNQESLHVGTALQNNSTLFAKKSKDKHSLLLSLQSSVYYSTETIDTIEFFTLLGTQSIPVDNAMYCGLAMDGWLRPYYQEWKWQIPIEDSRIQANEIDSKVIDPREKLAILFLKRYLASSN